MFETKLEKNLRREETVILLVRRYLLVFFWEIVVSALFIIAPFFFLVPLLRIGGFGILIICGLIAIGGLLAFRTFYVYSFNVFIITDERIVDIDQRGFFDRTVSETTYDKIQDVSFRIKGIMQTVFHFGSVIVQTAGTQANIELHGVKIPQSVQQAIVEVMQEKNKSEDITAGEIVKAINTLKKSEEAEGDGLDERNNQS